MNSLSIQSRTRNTGRTLAEAQNRGANDYTYQIPSATHHSLRSTVLAFWQLMRLDKPVGTLLLLWPTLAAVWMAADGVPSLHIVCAFFAGTVVMRTAGCVINDISDRKFDKHVRRTDKRPLAEGRLSVAQAWICAGVLLFIALGIVLTLNFLTQFMALAGLVIAAIYPLLKRVTNLPQLGLGLAFSWGILMADTAINASISLEIALLFAASCLWIIAYDTEYAMVDRDDDLKIGLKSIAILFGRVDRGAIVLLESAALGLLIVLGLLERLNFYYYACLAAMALMFVYQWSLIRNREADQCFKAFHNNANVGNALFLGIVLQYLPA